MRNMSSNMTVLQQAWEAFIQMKARMRQTWMNVVNAPDHLVTNLTGMLSRDKLHLPAKQVWLGRHIEDSAVCSSPKPSRTLDYLLLAISNGDKLFSSVQTMNTVHPGLYKSGNGSEKDRQVLEVRQPAAIGDSESEVMIITAIGAILGTLIPGATSFRKPGSTEFQKVCIVFAESQAFEEDCGAAVIDASTGCFYG
ncbi:unnamed protein product [Clonostachys solani]|uniref:Uncharacterized protein n=1 Tax=Clonostachys solani TaxID=160281 RepID=A0A9P0EJ27_9HYPO|nr:unnamed protein product [Clonostachys solani]